MGLWGWIAGESLAAVEWDEPPAGGTLACRLTRQTTDVKVGARLTVRDGQAVVLLYKGAVAEVCPPGGYVLDEPNLTALITPHGGRVGSSSVKLEVYAVSTWPRPTLPWATTAVFRAAAGGPPTRVRIAGTCGFQIDHPERLVRDLLASDPEFTTYEVGHLRNAVTARLADAIQTAGQAARDPLGECGRLAAQAGEVVAAEMARVGVRLTGFVVQDVGPLPDPSANGNRTAGRSGSLSGYARPVAAPPTPAPAYTVDHARPNGLPEPEPAYEDPLAPLASHGAGPQSGAIPLFDPGPGSDRFQPRHAGPRSGRLLLSDPRPGSGTYRPVLAPDPVLSAPLSHPTVPHPPAADSAPPPLPPQPEFHVALNGSPAGPFDLLVIAAKVRDGEVARNTLVWRRGMPGWLPAEQVPDLQSLFAAVPPELPPEIP